MSDFDNKLKEIADLREKQGKEEQTLQLISEVEKEVLEAKDYQTLVKLNWEKSLVWQHVAMNALAKMSETSTEADNLIKTHNITRLEPMSFRFLAQVYRYQKNFKKAEKLYKEAIDEYDKTQNVQSLELKGFLASVYASQEKTKEAIDLAIEVFNEFDTNPKAVDLKLRDYYVWAVWKSGIFPRLVFALDEIDVQFDKRMMSDYIGKSKDILVNPQGKITWGDDGFKFRLEEITRAENILSK